MSSVKKFVIIFWSVVTVGFVGLFLLFLLISKGKLGFMPTFDQLENRKESLATEIISADSVVIGKFYYENRSNVDYSEISQNLINALVSTEDVRYYEHSGIDFKSLGRVFFGIITGNSKGGGSTITQQLAKNLFPREQKNKMQLVLAKFKEWVVAVKLERNYSKDEIVAMYFNTVFFGNNAYGIKAASNIYFDKEPADLNVEEAALLVGMLKAPSTYNPRRYPDKAMQRRNVVLMQMNKNHRLDDAVYDSLASQPISMAHFKKQDHTTGMAKHFREMTRVKMTQWCKEHFKSDGSNYDLYSDGLRIYVTIDTRYQKYAEQAIEEWLSETLQPAFFKQWKGDKYAPFVFPPEDIAKESQKLMVSAMHRSERYRELKKSGMKEDSIRIIFNTPTKMDVFSWDGIIDTIMTPWDSIRYYKMFLRTGLVSVEPETGFVKAYACGPDYNYFQFDNITQMQRQVGSTFKPFLYTLAMQEGEYSPCSRVPNVQVSIETTPGKLWEPRNDSKKHIGEDVTLKWALAQSNNWISAYLIKRYGPEPVITIARKMGIKSDIPHVYSIALGTADISLMEMVGAMNTFASKGVHVEPVFITKICDAAGNTIESYTPKQEEAVDEQTAYLMLELMKGVVESGTGIRLRTRYNLTYPIAGKTGTTQNNSDGWFMGITPDLVSGVWTGCEDRSCHFKSMSQGQGANMALPIWALYMKKLYDDPTIKLSKKDFEKPDKPLSVEINCDKYDKLLKEDNDDDYYDFDQ